MFAIEIEILRQPAACLVDIRTSLVKSKGQSIQCSNDLSCLYLALFHCLIKRCAWSNYFGTTQKKHHTFIQPQFFNFNTLSDSSQCSQARGKQYISRTEPRQKVNDVLRITIVALNEDHGRMVGSR